MRRACVIGWPVDHARSPLIHSYWLREYGVAGHYGREAVMPGAVAAFLGTLAERGYVGCNVTIPHKEEALAALDHVDSAALALGAVNTIWLEDGQTFGMNTDVVGFLANLDETVPKWDQETKHALVMGAGGAARGVVYGLLSRGVQTVTVANRSRGKADALVAALGGNCRAIDLHDVPAALASVDLLVNTTSQGMKGQPPLDLGLDCLKPSAIVSDVVYVPLRTDLLVRADARGHRIVEGLGMLLHQAVPGFARWFGVTPKVTPALHALIAADIEAR